MSEPRSVKFDYRHLRSWPHKPEDLISKCVTYKLSYVGEERIAKRDEKGDDVKTMLARLRGGGISSGGSSTLVCKRSPSSSICLAS